MAFLLGLVSQAGEAIALANAIAETIQRFSEGLNIGVDIIMVEDYKGEKRIGLLLAGLPDMGDDVLKMIIETAKLDKVEVLKCEQKESKRA